MTEFHVGDIVKLNRDCYYLPGELSEDCYAYLYSTIEPQGSSVVSKGGLFKIERHLGGGAIYAFSRLGGSRGEPYFTCAGEVLTAISPLELLAHEGLSPA